MGAEHHQVVVGQGAAIVVVVVREVVDGCYEVAGPAAAWDPGVVVLPGASEAAAVADCTPPTWWMGCSGLCMCECVFAE